MKVQIQVLQELEEDEVVIRCRQMDAVIENIQKYVLQQTARDPEMTFYKDNQEYYFPLDRVLFFETDGEYVYAHTADDAYRIKYRLYELEKVLPSHFIRAAKATIINIRQVYSITRNLTASSLVQFSNSHKQVYVSRHYYQELRRCLNARR